MQQLIRISWKVFQRLVIYLMIPYDYTRTFLVFYFNGIKFSHFVSRGCPRVYMSLKARCEFGFGLKLNKVLNFFKRRDFCNSQGGQQMKIQLRFVEV